MIAEGSSESTRHSGPEPEPDDLAVGAGPAGPPTASLDPEARVARDRIEAALLRREPLVTRIGRFEIRSRLGAGGMGVVYSAYDPELEREVALKLIRAGREHDSQRAQRRLVREARALAKVSHPNVVPVYEVGAHQHDVFLAMELVEGRTLADWRREAPRRWTEVVPLMVAVARGVAAAHDAGVVHRDLKPQNILVGTDERPRVADFGLAAASEGVPTVPGTTTESGPDGGQSRTTVGGTVGYFAPELLDGASGDERSDQFAFCVTLWEVLFGTRPFPTGTMGQYIKALLEGAPPTVPRTPRVPRGVRAVLARGLAREPDRRHGSMHEVAAALQRVLDGRTRARWLLAMGAVTGTVATAALWSSPPPPSDPCADAGTEIEQIYDEGIRDRIGASLQSNALPFSRQITRKVLARLDDHARRWAAARHRACEAEQTAEPQAQARRACLDTAREELGAAIELLLVGGEQTVVQATKIADLPAPDRCDAPPTMDDGAPVPTLDPRLAQARALLRAGRYEEAIAGAREVLAQPRTPSSDRAWAHFVLGRTLMELEKWEDSREASEAAVWEAARLGLDALAAEAAAVMLQIVGAEKPEPLLRPVWIDIARTHAHRSADPAAELVVATIIGNALRPTGDHEAARTSYEQALRLAELVHGATSEQVAVIHQNLGALELAVGRYDEAVDHFDHAVHLLEEELGAGHPTTAMARTNRGNALVRRGDVERAIVDYEQALADRRAFGRRDDPAVLATMTNLSVALGYRGDAKRALELKAEVLESARRIHGPRSHGAGVAAMNLGISRAKAEDYEGAARMFEEAVEILAAAPEPTPELLQARGNLALAYLRLGKPAQAEPLQRQVIEDTERAFGPEHPKLELLLLGHAEALGELHRNAEARAEFRRAAAIAEASYPEDSPWRLEPYIRLARFEQTRDREAARTALRRAEELARALPEIDEDLREDLDALRAELR